MAVKLGEMFWLASVRGGDEAADTAAGLQDNLEGVAEAAVGASASQNAYGSEVEENTERTEEATRWTGKLDVATGLLGSALFFAGDMFGVAGTAATLYSGAVSVASFATTVLTGAAGAATTALGGLAGAATTAWAAIAGPAGLAAGLFLAVVGVGLLGSELLGLTDVTPVVAAETDTMKGLFADLAFLVGGPLVGYMSAGFSLLTGDFEAAKNKFINTSVEWAKASARFAARVQAGFAAFGAALLGGFEATVESIDYVWRAGLNRLGRHTARQLNSIVRQVERLNRLPGVNLNLGRVNPERFTVANRSLDARLSDVRGRNTRRIRNIQSVTRDRLDRFAPDTIAGNRPTSRTGSSGTNVEQQTVTVRVDASNLDLSNLSRSQRKELASLIGDEVGSSTGDLAGGK